MPSMPSSSARLACSRHHASAAGDVKSIGEPVPIHQRATYASPSPVAHVVAGAQALGVVRGRRAVQRARLRVGRRLALGGVEVHPGRDPGDGPHAGVAEAAHHPGEVRELVRVGDPRVVLRLPGRVEHERVERDRVRRAAVEVVLDLGLVAVDVARLPEAVAPLRQHGRQARRAQMAAQARRRRRLREQLDRAAGRRRCARRPPCGPRRGRSASRCRIRRRAPRSRARTAATAQARSRPAGSRRSRACRRGSRGRCRRGRRRAGCGARRGRRAARGARRARRSAPRRARPSRRRAQRSAVDRELKHDLVVEREREPQAPAAAAVEAQGEVGAVGQRLGERRGDDPLRQLELLGGDDAFRKPDELVADLAVGTPDPEAADQPPPVAAHVDGERPAARSRRAAPFVTARAPSATVAASTVMRSASPRRPSAAAVHTKVTARSQLVHENRALCRPDCVSNDQTKAREQR